MGNYKMRMINGMKCISEEEFCESEEKEPCSAATEDKAQA